jgi:hypothetical protein
VNEHWCVGLRAALLVESKPPPQSVFVRRCVRAKQARTTLRSSLQPRNSPRDATLHAHRQHQQQTNRHARHRQHPERPRAAEALQRAVALAARRLLRPRRRRLRRRVRDHRQRPHRHDRRRQWPAGGAPSCTFWQARPCFWRDIASVQSGQRGSEFTSPRGDGDAVPPLFKDTRRQRRRSKSSAINNTVQLHLPPSRCSVPSLGLLVACFAVAVAASALAVGASAASTAAPR